jgi:hypothetical protein
MVSEANLPLAPIVQGSSITPAVKVSEAGGNNLPPRGNTTAGAAAASSAATSGEPTAASAPGERRAASAPPNLDPGNATSIVAFLNKFLNDSGRPDQFRVDPTSDGKFIQEVNPASGAVVAEYAIAEFPALARGIGASGLLVDGLA